MTRKLLNYSFQSFAKYQECLASERREDERERNFQLQKEAASAAAEARKQELVKCKLQVKAADEVFADSNRDLDVALEFSKKILEKLSKLPKQKLNLVLDKKDSLRNVSAHNVPKWYLKQYTDNKKQRLPHVSWYFLKEDIVYFILRLIFLYFREVIVNVQAHNYRRGLAVFRN